MPTRPSLPVSFSRGRVTDRTEQFLADRAEICLIDDGWISLERSGLARAHPPQPVPADEMLHPWLVPAAATFNGWLGRQVLHGASSLVTAARSPCWARKKPERAACSRGWPAPTRVRDPGRRPGGGRCRKSLRGPACIDLGEGSVDALAPTSRRSLVVTRPGSGSNFRRARTPPSWSASWSSVGQPDRRHARPLGPGGRFSVSSPPRAGRRRARPARAAPRPAPSTDVGARAPARLERHARG